MTENNASSPTRGRRTDAHSKSGRVRELLKTGMSAVDIAKKVGCTTALVYNIKSKGGGAAKRGPGRPRKGASASMDGLAGILDAVKSSERERTQLRAALERIHGILADALG